MLDILDGPSAQTWVRPPPAGAQEPGLGRSGRLRVPARSPSSSRFTDCGLSQDHVEPLCQFLRKCEDLSQLE